MSRKSKKEKFEDSIPHMILISYLVQQFLKRHPDFDFLENQPKEVKEYIIKMTDNMMDDEPQTWLWTEAGQKHE